MATNVCGSAGGNTAAPGCIGKRRVPKIVLLGSKQFTSTEYSTSSTMKTAILGALRQSNGSSSKLFALPEVLQVTNNTEADTMGALGLGPQRRLKKGRHSYTYSHEVDHGTYQKLLAFDGYKGPGYTFDDAAQLWAKRDTVNDNTINTNVMKGEMVYVYVSGNGFEDGTNAETGVCHITISYPSIDEFEKNSVYASLPNMSTADMTGLIDIMLYEPSAHVSNVHKIGLNIPSPLVSAVLNPYDEFGSILAGLTWSAGTGANFGTTLAITSVAVDATNKCLTFTFDSTAYTALAAGAQIKVTPPNVTALIAGLIVGYEIGTIIVTK